METWERNEKWGLGMDEGLPQTGEGVKEDGLGAQGGSYVYGKKGREGQNTGHQNKQTTGKEHTSVFTLPPLSSLITSSYERKKNMEDGINKWEENGECYTPAERRHR